jgi:hypothetical protein
MLSHAISIAVDGGCRRMILELRFVGQALVGRQRELLHGHNLPRRQCLLHSRVFSVVCRAYGGNESFIKVEEGPSKAFRSFDFRMSEWLSWRYGWVRVQGPTFAAQQNSYDDDQS